MKQFPVIQSRRTGGTTHQHSPSRTTAHVPPHSSCPTLAHSSAYRNERVRSPVAARLVRPEAFPDTHRWYAHKLSRLRSTLVSGASSGSASAVGSFAYCV